MKISPHIFPYAIIISSFFLPVYLGTIGVLCISLLLSLVILFKYLEVNNSLLSIYNFYALFILYLLILTTSQPLRNYPIVFNDFQFFVFIAKDIVILHYFATVNFLDRRKILDFLIGISFLSSVICLIQYFNFFNLNSYYFDFITSEDKAEYYKTLTSSIRVLGFSPNPNVQAFLASIGSLGAWTIYFKEEKSKYLLAALFIFIFGVFLTGSRSGLFAYLLSLGVLYYLFRFQKLNFRKKIKKILWATIPVSLVLAVFLFVNIKSIESFKRYYRLLNWEVLMYSSSSLGVRINTVIPSLINDWLKYPFIGNGFAHGSSLFPYNDMGYLYYLRSFGIIGFGFLISAYISSIRILNKYSFGNNVFTYYSISIIVLISVRLLTQGFGLIRITPLIWLFIGLAINPTFSRYIRSYKKMPYSE